MSQSKSIEEIREFFARDRFATENGAVIDEVGEHYASCSIRITPGHMNAVGAVMGGVYFMLADFAFAVASNWESAGMVSLNSDISFMGAFRGERLIAQAHCLKNGRTTAFYNIELKDELGNVVAVVTTTGFRKG